MTMGAIGHTFAHAAKYFLGRDEPHTQTTTRERASLAKHVLGKRRIVEIGVYEGVTTRTLADTLGRDAVLYAVDPFGGGRVGICWNELIARRHAGGHLGLGKVIFVKAKSFEAARQLTGMFDFIFVDGDHSLEGITRDWHDWSPRVVEGGIVALHDTRPPAHDPSVADLGSCRYFASHIVADPRFALVEQVDSLSILRRTG